MNLPNDPFMLMSFLNTKLRDFYENLDVLCDDLALDKDELCKNLSAIGYEYDEKLNKFA